MYMVKFVDGETFEGGNPTKSLWNDIPSKPIAEVTYWITPFIKFTLRGYAEYNHCVEYSYGVNNRLNRLSKVIIMGQQNGIVDQVIFDDKGNVFKARVPSGREYSHVCKIVDGKFSGWVNGKPLSGWKLGHPNKGEIITTR